MSDPSRRLNLPLSGEPPTAPDPTTFGDALRVLTHFGLLGQSPPAVVAHLDRAVSAGEGNSPTVRGEDQRLDPAHAFMNS